jgi:hypothetical protein
MKYIHILLISCLLLCSCLFEEETEPENESLPSSSDIAEPSSSSIAEFSSSSVEPAEPSILDCPLEDLEEPAKYYPDPEFDPPDPGPEYVGYCRPSRLELSAEELSFSAQGGVRCVTSRSTWIIGAYGKDGVDCYTEMIVRLPDGSTFTGTGQEFREFFRDWNWQFYKLICPWFTATNVDVWSEGRHTLLVSVNKNETGNERGTSIGMSLGNCGGGFKITQSP